MTAPTVQIRSAEPEDACAISQLVATTLFRSNAADYPAKVLEQVAEANGPGQVRVNLETRSTLVAETGDGALLGTASAERDWLKSFFVHPDAQGQGIGRQMLEILLERLRKRGISTIWVQSSLTAVDFYHAAGFDPVREIIEDEDRTIVMCKQT